MTSSIILHLFVVSTLKCPILQRIMLVVKGNNHQKGIFEIEILALSVDKHISVLVPNLPP